MPAADPARVKSHIIDILNATTAGWGGAIDGQGARRSEGAVDQARIESGMEVLRAIASNAKHGDWGSLATMVAITHNQFLPAHDGEPGIPAIVPFIGAGAMEGVPADPDEIDSYRAVNANSLYTSGADGVPVAHDAADADGLPSAVACRYSIVSGRIKFTGSSAQIPLIQLTHAMADTGVPENLEPTIVKLSIPKLVKEGDNLFASAYAQAGMQDLIQIAGGAQSVSPVPDVVAAQRAGIT